MSIATDTFPLVCIHAANNPHLALRVKVENNKYVAELLSFTTIESSVVITEVFTSKQLERLHRLPQPVKINLVDNNTFKHLLDRLCPSEGIML